MTNNKREIPKGLREKQEKQRQETMKTIQDAINFIIEEGGIVTKQKLIEHTGLSSATFSKPHVKDLLKENKVCQFKETSKVKKTIQNKDRNSEKTVKLIREINLLESKIVEKDIKYNKIKKEKEDLERRYKGLLGKMHIFMREIENRNIDIGIDFDEL